MKKPEKPEKITNPYYAYPDPAYLCYPSSDRCMRRDHIGRACREGK